MRVRRGPLGAGREGMQDEVDWDIRHEVLRTAFGDKRMHKGASRATERFTWRSTAASARGCPP